ncbi:calcium-binding and coiled-coil domain-containing protein 1-like isoform X3 [Carcharodon carcharias]|uniref:calcium-binding and coiled-coil domain-containing protein 1-like isoform X3 n=1 Tax=Carcharodon carcharias TaxID=13397 RepID=UPI001B7E9B77|nr:calcium-binding and coiled-coil domain-containing protein 1-like isoform X3 [Carcharodon carcharias]
MEPPEVSPRQPEVTFHNVAHSYVPGAALECHYTLTSQTKWAANDWIGLFKVGWRSVRDYYTFVWSPAPHGQSERSPVNCCVRFEASYLPAHGSALYQFSYVDAKGTFRGSSTTFAFRSPEPEEDLVVLEELESSSDMLLVVTRSSLLESLAEERRLAVEECRSLRKQQGESTARIQELEADIRNIGHTLLERETTLDRVRDHVTKLTGKQEELGRQAQEETEERQLIQARMASLKLENQGLRERLSGRDEEVASLKAEVRQLLVSASDSEAKYDAVSEQLRCTYEQLSSSRQEAVLMGEEMARASSVRDKTISELHRSRLLVAELQAKLAEVSGQWEEAEGQWREERSIQRQILEVEKEKVLRLSAELLNWKASAQDREAETQRLKQELGRERDRSRVQVSEMLRQRNEMKSALQVAQKEKEVLQNEKQVIQACVKILEQEVQAKQREAAIQGEADRNSPAGELGTCVANERLSQPDSDPPEGTSSPLPRPQADRVVISQPVSIALQLAEAQSEVVEPANWELTSSTASRKVDLEPESDSAPRWVPPLTVNMTHGNGVTSLRTVPIKHSQDRSTEPRGPRPAEAGLDDGFQKGAERNPPDELWKKCPICKHRFPDTFGKQALEHHIDSHFFFSTSDPFIFQ